MMATMVMDTTEDQSLNAKSALRNALRAKLKSGSSFEDPVTTLSNTSFSLTRTSSMSSNLNYDDAAIKLIDVETIGNESDESGESDDKMDEKESTTTANSIPLEERRLRNRLAARKCREKRKHRIMNLEKICNNLESRIDMLTSEIEGLDGQKKNLQRLLENHNCVRLTPKPTAVIKNTVMSK